MKTLLAETFEQIVAAQQDRVLADTGEAEEAVQDTFMKFHRHWERVPHRARRVSRGSAALGRGKSRDILITRAGKSRDYAAGYRRVDDAVGAEVLAHLDGCRRCRAELAETKTEMGHWWMGVAPTVPPVVERSVTVRPGKRETAVTVKIFTDDPDVVILLLGDAE